MSEQEIKFGEKVLVVTRGYSNEAVYCGRVHNPDGEPRDVVSYPASVEGWMLHIYPPSCVKALR